MAEKQIHRQVAVDPTVAYLTGANISADEEQFVLGLNSGNQVRRYAVSPKHAKRIMLLFQKFVGEYEKKFGELNTKLPEVKGQTNKKNQIGFVAEENNN